MTFWQLLLALVLMFTGLLLMLVILLQRGRGGGLVGAFGGAGGTSAFGAKTGDVFTWITVVVAGVFVLLSIAANYVFDQSPQAQEASQITSQEVEVPVMPVPEGAPAGTVPVTVTPVQVEGSAVPAAPSPPTDPGPKPADPAPGAKDGPTNGNTQGKADQEPQPPKKENSENAAP